MQSETPEASKSAKPNRLHRPRVLIAAAFLLASAGAAVAVVSGIHRFWLGERSALAGSCTSGVTTYSYDGAGRLIQEQIGCSYTATYSYDAVGNLLSVSP